MYVDCEAVYSSSSAVKQTSETLRKKINPVPLFCLCWLHSELSSSSQRVTLSWRFQNRFRSNDLICWRSTNLRLRFSTALRTSSSKVFWSKGDSSHFENSPSFQISWTYSDGFQILNEKFIHDCLPCLLAKMAKVASSVARLRKCYINCQEQFI